MEFILAIAYLLISLIIIIGIIAAFYLPILTWEERQEGRKRENISMTKWDYAQEVFLVLISPIVLSSLGVRYLVEFFDLKF